MMVSNEFIKLHLMKFDLFKSQNCENGRFDVVFDIDGKLLFAHKTMLNLVSDTFDSMLSDRWIQKKDEPIKITEYSYENFYQFLTFLYSGQCQLIDSNIYSMIDIAEFYGVEIFKNYCEKYLSNMKITAENIFFLIELADKYTSNQLKYSVLEYIIDNFQSFCDSDGFLKINKSILEELVISVKDNVKHENLFKAVYKWSEKQATNKQKQDPKLILNDAIKSEISVFLPFMNFRRMGLKYFSEFVVSRGFIFSSWIEVSKILSDFLKPIKVKVTNKLGQTLSGNLVQPNDHDEPIIENFKALSTGDNGVNTACWWNAKFKFPSTPSSLKKRKEIEWYLLYFADGDIGVVHRECIVGSEYLIAELTGNDENQFRAKKGCHIEIE